MNTFPNQVLTEQADKKDLNDAYHQKLADNERLAEERTAKKRAKRLKKKQNKKMKKGQRRRRRTKKKKKRKTTKKRRLRLKKQIQIKTELCSLVKV